MYVKYYFISRGTQMYYKLVIEDNWKPKSLYEKGCPSLCVCVCVSNRSDAYISCLRADLREIWVGGGGGSTIGIRDSKGSTRLDAGLGGTGLRSEKNTVCFGCVPTLFKLEYLTRLFADCRQT